MTTICLVSLRMLDCSEAGTKASNKTKINWLALTLWNRTNRKCRSIYPCQTRFRHPTSASAGTLAGNRTIRLPSSRHPTRSRQVRRLPCNDLWPSCYQRRIGQKRNCPDGRFDRKDQIGRNPLFRAPNPQGRLWGRISHRRLRCSRRRYVQAAARTRRDKLRWGRFHVHR